MPSYFLPFLALNQEKYNHKPTFSNWDQPSLLLVKNTMYLLWEFFPGATHNCKGDTYVVEVSIGNDEEELAKLGACPIN